jgi:ubiquinone/menaquinone biosynthesis C-methylase UbiE
MQIVEALCRLPALRWGIYLLLHRRMGRMARRISADLPAGAHKLCDLGSGTGLVGRALRSQGYDVTPIDVMDLRFFSDFPTVVYDGKTLPFARDAFDVAILAFTLHHCTDPERVLAEALRVAPVVVVLEDVVLNRVHRWATMITDSLLNLEFFGHPHQNHTDAEWRAIFARLGADARRTRAAWEYGPIYQVSYVLTRQGAAERAG